MNTRTLLGKTLLLSVSHFFVRLIGFAMRIWLSRELGAQAMGLVELAQSAQMLLITPVVSGLPAAISRMCAKEESSRQIRVLRCGIALALALSIPLTIAAFLLRVPLALWLGDIRTMPSLLCYLPCIPVLGVSCVLNGYYYGTGRPAPPAVCEILEQIVRFFLTVRIVSLLRGWPITLRAAAPAAAALAGETVSLLLMLLLSARLMFSQKVRSSRRQIYSEMITLALPLTGMRLVSSLMRTVQSVLIPERLQCSGLNRQQALAHFGMMSGMLMPVLMIPSFITCSLCMVAQPEITRRQSEGRALRRPILRLLRTTLTLGFMTMACVYICAPLFSDMLYREQALFFLIRRCCPMIPIMALCQVTSGIMNALGLQCTSLRISLASNLLSVLLMFVLAALPQLQLYGVMIAMGSAQLLTLALSLRVLLQKAH